MILTKSYQKVAETYLGNTGYGDVYIRCYAKVNNQSLEDNSSNVSVESRIYLSRGEFLSSSGTTASATVDGETASSSANRTYSSSGSGETVVASKTKNVSHNNDGTKSINVSSSWSSQPWSWSETASATVDLPKIDRYPVLNYGQDFDDEHNPTYNITNIGLYPVRIKLEAGGNPQLIVRDIPQTTTGDYELELTNEERNTLRALCPNGNTLRVIETVCAMNGNTELSASYKAYTMTIVNANPTMTYTITETNQKVINLLGTSANTIIENVSQLNFNVVPTTYKGASVKQVLCGNRYDYLNRKSKTTSPYSIDIPVKSENTFIVVVYDSRDNLVQDIDIQKTMIEYQPVDITSFSFKRVNPTSSNIVLNLEARYFQKTFGSTANVPVVKWKLDDGTYTTIPSSAYTIDTTNHKLTITNYQLTNVLDYRQQGQFALYIEDLLTTDTEGGENGKVLKGIPTFDAGEHDLKVNGDLFVADQNGNNKVNVLNACLDHYDTNEIEVGKWINNETIYRKVIDTGQISSQLKNVAHGISNLGGVIRLWGIAKSSAGNYYTLPRVNSSDMPTQIGLECTSQNIVVRAGTNTNFASSFAIIDYTKSS